MHKPLPAHDKHTAYIEISKSGFKFICVLVAEKRTPVRMFTSLVKCKQFAADNGLDFQLVGALA
ncbi:hypothetical protein LVJ82_17690 [Vitreoscilla massiliensis]|uniref:Transposase n=1 Tax=Vitreoscilla massiliensis TaxID=1689272 RepID=A0ABY4E370_9NEIS|nr:hypothetical protein [Vitreoscilla massiliensis]UOO89250.1 hypothetical protein LVJ82_17690 [Vitreoscilla massiliensis]